ncbi:MAG TPA: hypothetical protein VFR02_09315, partial [bacterium]|nr:hypothetical protein [bacterium]
MKKINAARQLKGSALVLFLSALAGLEFFGMGVAAGLRGLPVSLTAVGEILLLLWLALAALEMALARALGGGEPRLAPLALGLCHSPFLLGFALPLALRLPLPAPHDFAWRKIQILFGVMWVSHLFLYTAWLLWKGRKGSRPVSSSFLAAA